MCGNTPSSMPVRNTTGNSRPLAVCNVISVTALWSLPSSLSAASVSMSVTSEIASRNAWIRGRPSGIVMSPAVLSAVPTPAMPGRPDTSPASSAWSNSWQTPTSSCRFSMRPRASIDRSASSSAR